MTALAAAFLLGMLEDRRQAFLGLLITVAALLIIIWNDPNREGGDLFFLRCSSSPSGSAVSG